MDESTNILPQRPSKKPKRNKKGSVWRLNVQLACAVFLVLCGCTLLFFGFWVAPTGQIHNSVLVAFGEASTFAGGLFGIDYSYKYKKFKNDK